MSEFAAFFCHVLVGKKKQIEDITQGNCNDDILCLFFFSFSHFIDQNNESMNYENDWQIVFCRWQLCVSEHTFLWNKTKKCFFEKYLK